jgi:LmbE family N-acetylglucosaminyl deacetylase
MSRGADANRYVDVTDAFDRKVEALRAHESQTSHMDGLEDMLRMWLTMNAQAAGFADGRLAEAYRVLDTR